MPLIVSLAPWVTRALGRDKITNGFGLVTVCEPYMSEVLSTAVPCRVTLTASCSIQHRSVGMPLNAHIAELKRRHELLERELEAALNHPSADDTEINKLKRKKLRLKDEIAKFDGSATRH
jgi:hypothetical protein